MIATLNTDNVCLDDLPGILREMAGQIGLSATLVIVQHFGGVRLYVPITMTPEHILSRLIGFEAALKLSNEYGGLTHFDIPRAVAALRSARNAEMSDKFIKGKSVRELALYYLMTERGITKILATQGVGMDDRQADLF